MPGATKSKSKQPKQRSQRGAGAGKPPARKTAAKKIKRTAPRKHLVVGSSGDYNKYLKCLQNPWDYDPVRLGGTSCHTGLLTQRIRFVINMSGISNINGGSLPATQTDTMSVLFCPFVQSSVLIAGWTSMFGGSYDYVGPTGVAAVPTASSITTSISAVRPIAAGIRLELIANTANNQGTAVATCFGTGIPVQQTYANNWYEQAEKAVCPAVNGIYATWRPLDSVSYQFNAAYVSGPGIVPNTASWTSSDLPVLALGMTNLSTTTPPSIAVEIVTHWETIVAPTSIGLVNTAQGNMTANQQQNTLSGTILQSLKAEFGSWTQQVGTNINQMVKTGLISNGMKSLLL